MNYNDLYALDEDADGNLKIVAGDITFVGGARAVAISARNVLALRLGEYVINLDLGLDWQLGGIPNIPKLRADVMRLLSGVAFVAAVLDCTVRFDKTTRALTATYRVRTTESETVDGEGIISV